MLRTSVWNLPTSLSVWLPSPAVGTEDRRTLVVCIVVARDSLVEVGIVAIVVLIGLLVVLRNVDCMALLVVMVATEESTVAVVVTATAIDVVAIEVVVVNKAVSIEVVATILSLVTVVTEAASLAVAATVAEIVSTSVALVVTLGLSDTAVLGIITELLEEYILVDAVVLELIITEIESAIVESKTTEVIAVVLGFSVDIWCVKLAELILAIIIEFILLDVVEEASIVSETLVLYSGPVPHLLAAVTVIV